MCVCVRERERERERERDPLRTLESGDLVVDGEELEAGQRLVQDDHLLDERVHHADGLLQELAASVHIDARLFVDVHVLLSRNGPHLAEYQLFLCPLILNVETVKTGQRLVPILCWDFNAI